MKWMVSDPGPVLYVLEASCTRDMLTAGFGAGQYARLFCGPATLLRR